MNLNERLKEIQARLAELDNEENIENAKIEQLEEMKKEAEELVNERASIEANLKQELRKQFEKGEKQTMNETKTKENEILETRGRDLLEKRAITLGSLDLIAKHHEDEKIQDPFNEVSEIVDLVGKVNLQGGESYKKGYVKNYGEAGETAEGADYNETEPKFDYVDITKVKLTAYAEITEELKKLSLADYQAQVVKNLTVALKKKLNNEILFGVGGSGHITGIFTNKAKAIEAKNDITIKAVDENTLDDIVLSYGSTEEYTPATLILSKKTLKDFAKVRGTDKKRVYAIDYKNKTIDGVPYYITSGLKGVSEAKKDDYVLGYGSLTNYELTSFAPVEITQSDDFKFRSGQTAYRASGFFGGNVVAFNGFVRVKKGE